VQEAAYATIASARRPAAHLRIGRLLAEHLPAHLPEQVRSDAIFDVVNLRPKTQPGRMRILTGSTLQAEGQRATLSRQAGRVIAHATVAYLQMTCTSTWTGLRMR